MAKHDLSSADEEENVGGSTSTSNGNRKRVRIDSSLPPSSPPPTQSAMSAGIEDATSPRVNGHAPGNDEEQDEPSTDEDQDAEDRQELERTKKSDKAVGEIAKAGVIKRVELQNFMCHTLVDVKFGPQLNFLVGHNGSGKSAILSGIMMALGAAGRATGRAKANKSFVKDGSQYAVCKVEIRNEGPEAYQPEVFGKTICVERRLNTDMGGSYKIKDHAGKTVDTKKLTLDRITDYFNIQVNNPMTVLTQDNARQFLANSTSKMKYEFFLRGTQLAQLTEEYEIIRNNMEVTTDLVTRKEDGLADLKLAYRAAKKKMNDAEQAIEQGVKLERLKHELVWSFVDEVDSEILSAADILAAEVRTGEKVQVALDNLTVARDEAAVEVEEIDEAQKDLAALNVDDAEGQKTLKVSTTKNRAELRVLHDQNREALNTIRRINDEIVTHEVQIVAERARLERDSTAVNQPIYDEINELNDKISKIGLQAVAADNAGTDLDDKVGPLNDQLAEIKVQIVQQGDTWKGLKARLNHLATTARDPYAAFGEGTAKLVGLINKYKKWNDKPLGPIGSFVKLDQPLYGPIIESFTNEVLNAFIVTNKEDRATLLGMLRTASARNPIVMQRQDPSFNCSHREPPAGILTIRRALRVSHPFVEMVLINSLRIETTLLCERRAEGDQIMRNRMFDQYTCLSADMYRVGGISGGSSSMYAKAWNGASRLLADNSAQVNRIKGEQEAVTIAVQNLEQEKSQLDQELTGLHRKKQGLETTANRCRDEVRAANHQIRKLTSQLVQDVVSNLEVLEGTKKASEEELDTSTAQYQVLRENIQRLGAENKPLVAELEALDAKQKSFAATRAKLNDRYSKAIEKRVTADAAIATGAAKTAKRLQQIAIFEGAVQQLKDKLANRIVQASTICERPVVKTKKSSAKLAIEVDQTTRALQQREKQQGGTAEDISAEFNRTRDVATKAVNDVAEMKKLLSTITSAYNTRLARWINFRASISARARVQFIFYLEKRSFTGKLTFDHDKLDLHLKVVTNQIGNGSGKSKQVAQLSGGEKSFSTICLLLTLWEVAQSKIRCLDEYDVYMDAVNRRTATRLMVQTAQLADETQFILITPQNIANEVSGVTIVQLQDPGRNQGTLAFGKGGVK